MSQRGKTCILTLADSLGWEASVAKTGVERSEAGQFFTSREIAGFLAGWFSPRGLNRPILRILDPGAGGGILTAALARRIASLRAGGKLPLLREVNFEAWELDQTFLAVLEQNLSACAETLENEGIEVVVNIRHGDFIESSVEVLDIGLFTKDETPPGFTHAILNPPYRKISSASRERRLLASIGIEVPNFYAAFIALSLRQMSDGAEMAAITPRSFCNGPYFRNFRRDLLAHATFRYIHIFESRSEAFGRDQVLQENILFQLVRREAPNRDVNLSTGPLENSRVTRIRYEQLVSPLDPDGIIHIATESDAAEIRSFFDSLPCTLTDLDLEVSTGPVVDFRLRESLSDELGPGSVPLIYPHCVKTDRVMPPPRRSSEFRDTRHSKKAVAIHDNDATRRWLLPVDRFVLIKRFSSKEEKRRLVSGVLNPADFPPGLIGIENHINFFHRKRSGLAESIAKGLSRFLNSTVADRYFRQFNGHTQVNASDLRSFRYPDRKTLEILGNTIIDDTCQRAIDAAMVEFFGVPSFADS